MKVVDVSMKTEGFAPVPIGDGSVTIAKNCVMFVKKVNLHMAKATKK